MHTRTMTEIDIIRFQVFAEHAAGSKACDPSFYSIKSKAGSMLVAPVNGEAFVVDFTKQVVTVFESQPGSGTDKLRQRVHAMMYFEGLPEQLELLRAA